VVWQKLVRDMQFRQLIIKTQKFETFAIGIVQFYHLLAHEQETIDTKTSVNVYLKNLLYFIHQNFLVAAKFIYTRIASRDQGDSAWLSSLHR
jgi:hypothetical protein